MGMDEFIRIAWREFPNYIFSHCPLERFCMSPPFIGGGETVVPKSK